MEGRWHVSGRCGLEMQRPHAAVGAIHRIDSLWIGRCRVLQRVGGEERQASNRHGHDACITGEVYSQPCGVNLYKAVLGLEFLYAACITLTFEADSVDGIELRGELKKRYQEEEEAEDDYRQLYSTLTRIQALRIISDILWKTPSITCPLTDVRTGLPKQVLFNGFCDRISVSRPVEGDDDDNFWSVRIAEFIWYAQGR